MSYIAHGIIVVTLILLFIAIKHMKGHEFHHDSLI